MKRTRATLATTLLVALASLGLFAASASATFEATSACGSIFAPLPDSTPRHRQP